MTEQHACALLDQHGVHRDVRGLDQLVDCRLAEGSLLLGGDLRQQPAFDLRAQLVQRLELARGARQLVVERRQHLLLDLLDGHGHRGRFAVGEPEGQRSTLAGLGADQTALDLADQAAGVELDDVVAALLALFADEVDDKRVALLDRPALDRRQLGDARPQGVELVLDESLGQLGLGLANLELAPVGELRQRLHVELGAEAPVRVGGGRQLELEPRLGNGTQTPLSAARRSQPPMWVSIASA